MSVSTPPLPAKNKSSPQTDPTPPPAPMRGWKRYLPLLAGPALFLVTILAYLPALRNHFVNFDDPEYVTFNLRVQEGLTWEGVRWAFTTGHAANWHPLTWLSHMIDWGWYGWEPWGHHLTNILLHGASAWVLYLALFRMTGFRWRSLFVAALFALHPLRVESVAWISERKDALSTLFWMLTTWSYAVFVANRGASRLKQMCWYGATLLLFALGLMAKPMLVTLPCVFLLLDFWPLGRFQAGKLNGLILEKIPFLVLAAASSYITMRVQEGAMSTWESVSIGMRIENAIVAYAAYVVKLVWPSNLSAFYPRLAYWPTAHVVGSVVLVLGLTLLAWLQRRARPYLLVGWLWFLGTAVPVIGLITVGGQAMADRYTYIPTLGLGIMLTWSAAEWAQAQPKRLPWVRVGAALSLAICTLLTIRQIGFWKDSETLFRRVLAVTPPHHVTVLNFAIGLTENRKYEEAAEWYEKGLELSPDSADIFDNYGLCLHSAGRSAQALPMLQRAVELDPTRATAYSHLAIVQVKLGRVREAEQSFRQAVELDRGGLQYRFPLACVLANHGQPEEAIAQLRLVVARLPKFAPARALLAESLRKQGQAAEATAEWKAALALNPANADGQNNLGLLLAEAGHIDQAIPYFREALRLKPTHPDAGDNLKVAEAMLKEARR